MKINRQFQDLHLRDTSGVDWVALQKIERDICLLYHQLAVYAGIMPDLYYGNVFGSPYWDYLNVPNIEHEQQAFIRNGCLVMLYAMAVEVLDGIGAYLVMDRTRFDAAKAAVRCLPQFDADTDRLIRVVRGSFKLIDEGKNSSDKSPVAVEVVDASAWIHDRFVKDYFVHRAKEFETNPYFRGERPE